MTQPPHADDPGASPGPRSSDQVRGFLAGSDRMDEAYAGLGARLARGLSVRTNQACALLLLVVLSPALAFIALSIWRRDGAPVLYGHYRVGYRGRLFRCLKFRSMYLESDRMLRELLATDEQVRLEWERDRKLERDPRITPIGHFLRRTSLDELPQLLNVLRGEMALIGPRPITLSELPRYQATRWHYLSVRPGMTGLWQVSGRNDTTYDERVELDRHYVETRGLRMSLRILWRTVGVVLIGSGAR